MPKLKEQRVIIIIVAVTLKEEEKIYFTKIFVSKFVSALVQGIVSNAFMRKSVARDLLPV